VAKLKASATKKAMLWEGLLQVVVSIYPKGIPETPPAKGREKQVFVTS